MLLLLEPTINFSVKLAILIPDARNAEEYWWTKDYAFPVLFKWFRTINLDRCVNMHKEKEDLLFELQENVSNEQTD